MILKDGNNRFGLELAGYQFPELDEGKYDANYLKIRTSLQVPQGSHRVSDPCLFTWEVGWLAMWLHNVARDVPQTTTTGGIEPSLEFEHLLTEGDAVALRVHLSQEMAPPWTDAIAGTAVDFIVSRKHVEEASASLWRQLDRFPPRGGAEKEPPFAPQPLSPTCFIQWRLVIPASSQDEAVGTATDFLRWIGLEPDMQTCGSAPARDNEWHVRAITDLRVPADDPFRAVFQLLSHLSMPDGAPRVHRPYVRPNGALQCSGTLDPTEEDEEDPLSRIRGWFELTNYEQERRFEWMLRDR